MSKSFNTIPALAPKFISTGIPSLDKLLSKCVIFKIILQMVDYLSDLLLLLV